MHTVPQVVFHTRVRDESIPGDNPFRWRTVSGREIFSSRRIVLFGLPGAFTPTCSNHHLPGYERMYDQIIATGVDEIYCLAVNDAFTMFQWGCRLHIDKVKMLPDGNGDFTRLMGMLVNKSNLGFGYRSWRYSMLVNNGEIVKFFEEAGRQDNCPDDPFEVSDAASMLEYLKN